MIHDKWLTPISAEWIPDDGFPISGYLAETLSHCSAPPIVHCVRDDAKGIFGRILRLALKGMPNHLASTPAKRRTQ